jgi:PAS domain S-box-containing protein
MTGYSRAELIGKSAEILYIDTKEFQFVGKEKYRQIAETGTGSVESKFKCKDGSIINVILSSTPLDIQDLSKGVTFTVLDITERKKSEEALKESQQLFQTLSQVSPVGIFRTRLDGFTTYVNPEWLELSGMPKEEAVGFGWLKAVHPDDRDRLTLRWEEDVNLRKTSVAEYRFLRPDGSIVWVMGNAVPEWTNNKIVGYIGTITNITDRKQSEIALQKSEEKYRRIFENVQDVYYETSIDGEIFEVSPSIEILSRGQYKMEDLLGKSIYDFYAKPNERQIVMEEFMNKGSVTDFEITLKNKDGSQIPCSISAKFVMDANMKPERIIGSMHDITERKNASDALRLGKEKAETSDRLKTEFLNNISHEVRTPLNGILGFAEIISIHDLTEAEKKDALTMLFESSNRLLNTITNYMDISLIASGSLSVTKKDFTPSEILRRIFENYETLCANRQLNFFLEMPERPDSYNLNSDPEICKKIISHFLDNAVKFTENGSINFGFTQKGEVIEFFVRDTGIGINHDSINTIFERFVKEDHGPYKISEGSGLGLSIARGMADAVNGNIRLESKPGSGSTFYLSLPVSGNNKKSEAESPNKDSMVELPSSPILIAEDDETNFYYLNALLNRETKTRILHAVNGREAIEIFKANPDIKLILMDMKMPEMDGFEATRQIKMLSDKVHIVAITAYAMSGDEERVLASGCDAYLSKPINKQRLLDKISEFIKI